MRYTALISGIFYGIVHQGTLQQKYDENKVRRPGPRRSVANQGSLFQLHPLSSYLLLFTISFIRIHTQEKHHADHRAELVQRARDAYAAKMLADQNKSDKRKLRIPAHGCVLWILILLHHPSLPYSGGS